MLGIAGALLASYLNWPLPWIIGSMLAVILVHCLGWHVAEIPHGRLTGQWMIATSIGLHFTPVVVEQILGHFALMLSAVFFTLLQRAPGADCSVRSVSDVFHRQRYTGSGPCPFAQRLALAITAIDRWCADGNALEA